MGLGFQVQGSRFRAECAAHAEFLRCWFRVPSLRFRVSGWVWVYSVFFFIAIVGFGYIAAAGHAADA